MAAVAIAVVANAAMMLTYSETRIEARGTIKTVGVEAYWDVSCTDKVTEIDWGTLEPGSQTETLFHIKNQGNAPVTLSLGVEDWSPSEAQNYMSVDWDYDGSPVNPGAAIPVRVTLAVSADIAGVTAFSFQIIIAAQG